MAAGADLLAGGAYAQGLTDNLRKAHAFNALENVYGPIAGDPARAQATQNYFNSVVQDPLKTKGLALQNDATQLSNEGTAISNRTAGSNQDAAAALRAAQFLKLHANPDGSINPDAINQVMTPENAALFGMDAAHLDPTKQLFGSVQGAGAVDHIISALQSGGAGQLQGTVQYGTDPNTGAPVEILHTKNGQTIVRPVQGGVTPTIVTNADTGIRRAATGQQTADTAAFNAGVGANNSPYGSPTGALMPGANQTTVPGGTPSAKLADVNTKRANALSGLIERTDAVPGIIDQAAALIPKLSQSGIMRKARAEIPGTPEYQLAQLAGTINANLSADDIRFLRETGTALGRPSFGEFAALGHAYGNLDLGQDPSTLAANFARLKATYRQFSSIGHAEINRLNKPAAAPAPPAAPATPAKQTGGISPAAVDMLIKKHGNDPAAAIQATVGMPGGDAIAVAIANRWAATHPPKDNRLAKPPSDADLFKMYGVK